MLAVSAIIALITLAHYNLGHEMVYLHDVSRRLYYLPIIMAGLWFGKKGGIYTAGAITALYFPHALFAWYGRHPRYLDNIIEIIFFNVVGYLIGIYIEKRNQRQRETEQNTLQLEEAYTRLKEQSEQLAYLEEKLRFSDRLSILGELTASLAHEIRNPLGGIQGAAEIIRRKAEHMPELTEFAQIQMREIGRLNQVVENYLSLARKDSSSSQAADLCQLISDTLKLSRLSAAKKDIQLSADLPKQAVSAVINPLQIQQVLLNLTLNSIQALTNGGKVSIRLTRENKTACISVQDNGPGIPEADRDKIFTTFFTTKKTGTGLGLSIVRRIVQQHTGKIDFETGPQGTTFYVHLPLENR